MENVTRRDLIMGTVKASSIMGLLGAGPLSKVFGVTPSQGEGPFHPVNRDNDLTRKSPTSPKAEGDVVYIFGKVVDEKGDPLAGALVEIWQAAANGKYNHPGDPNPKPVDPNFQYWGRETTNEEGAFAFKTIRPGFYPATPTWTRPAHIHYRVLRRGYQDLTTQMYFSPENDEERKLLENDHLLNQLGKDDQQKLIVDFKPVPTGSELEPGSKAGEFVVELRSVQSS